MVNLAWAKDAAAALVLAGLNETEESARGGPGCALGGPRYRGGSRREGRSVAVWESGYERGGADLRPWDEYVVPPFPLDVLSEDVRRFVETQSRVIGCDPSAVAMSVLAACSGALDHRFALKMLRNGDWYAHPRLWVLLVGDPSRKKTPAIRRPQAALRGASIRFGTTGRGKGRARIRRPRKRKSRRSRRDTCSTT